jgi:ubiquitin carboxyl-terminal hydrolase 16/45
MVSEVIKQASLLSLVFLHTPSRKFSQVEISWFASRCTEEAKKKGGHEKKVYTTASKQMLIAFPPPILTLHLKRFQAEGLRSVNFRKINRFVGFGLELDLSPWVSKASEQLSRCMGVLDTSKTIKYSLFGIVEHSGTLRSGHYTAYVKMDTNDNKSSDKLLRLRPFVATVDKLLEAIDVLSLNDDEDSKEEADGGSATAAVAANSSSPKWFHISDSHVSSVTEHAVLSAQAYILFYERL